MRLDNGTFFHKANNQNERRIHDRTELRGGDSMINKKSLFVVAVALMTALILSSLAVMRTARSEVETQGNSDIVMFLQIDGIPGESTNALHMNWIDIGGFNWKEAMASILSTSGGRAPAKINLTDFFFETLTNKASPMLFLACATGKYIPNAVLDVCTPFGSETVSPLVFLRFNFTQVTITSYGIAGSTPMDRSADQFSIAFSKLTMTYWQIDEVGNVVAVITVYYDLIAGRGGIL